jgi:hypothetical protein
LTAAVDTALPLKDQVLWMVKCARQLIPNESKSAAVIDLVLADYLSNPDTANWERTRDLLYDHFQLHAADHGYRFLAWYESSINLGTGLMALLYGEGDLKRTIRIGALSGWDSDNGTATMGGLIGLLRGTKAIRDAFPDRQLSLQYRIARTRTGFAHDVESMEAIADRMMPLIDKMIIESGGSINGDVYTIPRVDVAALTAEQDNPRSRDLRGSVNNSAAGIGASVHWKGGVTATGSAPDASIADGLEFDFSGRDRQLPTLRWNDYQWAAPESRCVRRESNTDVSVSVEWQQSVRLLGIRFVAGDNQGDGGYFDTLHAEVRNGNRWRAARLAEPYARNTEQAFNVYTLRFDKVVKATGIRLRGTPGGASHYVTLCELDGLQPL